MIATDLLKYREDQARDERGRFTDEGAHPLDLDEAQAIDSRDAAEAKLGIGENVSDNRAGRYKAMVARSLGTALAANPAWAPDAKGAVRGVVSIERANAKIAGWSATSGDASPTAIGMQLAAKEEFGLRDVADQHWNMMALGTAINRADEGVASDRAFLREMYNQTQADIAKLGIDGLYVYRGTGWDQRPDDVGSYPDGHEATVRTQPMSSWSLNPWTTTEFAAQGNDSYGRIDAMWVPRDRILSTPRTGFGCTSESEVVVLGGTYKTMSTGWEWGGDYSEFDAMNGLFDSAYRQATKAEAPAVIGLDDDLRNADWPKRTWDLPMHGAPDFRAALDHLGLTAEQFAALPAAAGQHPTARKVAALTDDGLVALRSILKEWDEGQHPREPAGSPEGGEFAGGSHSFEGRDEPALARMGMPGMVQIWRRDPNGVRSGQSRFGPASNAATGVARKAIMDAITGHPDIAPTLYRGMATKYAEAGPRRGWQDSIAAQFPVGGTVDLNLSSFSSSRDDAVGFSDASAPPERIMLVLDSGAKGLDIGDARFPGTFYDGDAHEWLTAGRFRVESVTETPDWLYGPSGKYPDETGDTAVHSYEIHITQTDPLTAKIAATNLRPNPVIEDSLGGHADHRPSRRARPSDANAMSTADLLALRATLKYNDNHDERGRFTTAEGNTLPTDGDKLEWAERRAGQDSNPHAIAFIWSGGGMYGREGSDDLYRQALSKGFDTVTPAIARDASVLARAVDEAKPTTYPLYRGIMLRSATAYAPFADIAVGKTIDMNLCSWSRSKDVAADFARGAWSDDGPVDHQVIFKMEAGGKAFDATHDIAQGPQYTEHLSDGRFEVTAVNRTTDFDRWGMPADATIDTITLRQTATFKTADMFEGNQFEGTKAARPGSLPFAAAQFLDWLEPHLDARMVRPTTAKRDVSDQPRDEHGRWTDGGGDERLFPQPPVMAAGLVGFSNEFAGAYTWLHKQYDPWVDALSDGQRRALQNYASFQYQVINGVMRGQVPSVVHYREGVTIDGHPIPDYPVTDVDVRIAREDAANLSMAIERAPALDVPTTVFRSMSNDQLAGLRAGDTFTDKGFTSTSLLRADAQPGIDVPNEVTATIHLPEGIRAAFPGYSVELVLQAGTTFRVNSTGGDGIDLSVAQPGDLVLSGNVGKAARRGAADSRRYLWTAGMVEVHGTGRAKAAGSRRITSGGARRDASLNPIVERLKQRLMELARDQGALPAEKSASSPLTFALLVQAAIEQAYTEAWEAGYDDSDADEELSDRDEEEQVAAATRQFDPSKIASLLVGGAISAPMLLARLAQIATMANVLYEYGFAYGVQSLGEVTRAEWVAEGDKATCDLCSARDGQVWFGDQPHPYPGQGTYGDVCEGGPNCRCEIVYTVVPESTDPSFGEDDEADIDEAGGDESIYGVGPTSMTSLDLGDDITLGSRPDLAKVATADLAVIRAILKEWDESQHPRDDHGRFAGDGSWADPGPQPDYRAYGEPFSGGYYDANRAWQGAMGRGVALGKISPVAAQERGWNSISHPEDAVKPLPATLYHATVAVDAVLAGGLKTQDEMAAAGIKATGLGGGSTDTISFTTDRAFADRIADVIVEAHDVATGKITPDDLVDRAREGLFEPRMAEFYETINGTGSYDLYRDGLTRVNSYSSDWPDGRMVASRDEMIAANGDVGWQPAPDAGHVTGGDGADRYAAWVRPMTAPESMDHTFALYRAFLLAQSEAGGPTDPVMWAPKLDYYAGIDPAQVAVVEAHPIDGAMGYYVGPAEAEWRTWSGDAVTVAAVKAWRPDTTKDNPYHDERGRFTTADGAAGASAFAPSAMDAARERLEVLRRMHDAVSGYWSADALKGITRDAFERTMRSKRDGEAGLVIGPDGKPVFVKAQDGSSINFTDDEARQMADGTLTHNHPNGWEFPEGDPRRAGNALSPDDLRLAIDTNMAEIRAVAGSGTYSVRRPDAGWPPIGRVIGEMAMLDYDVRNDFNARILGGYADWGATAEERAVHASAEHYTEFNTRLARYFGWDFSFEPAVAS